MSKVTFNNVYCETNVGL